MKIYVLYEDYDSDEGCSEPKGVTFSAAEADAWEARDEKFGPGTHCTAVFDVTITTTSIGKSK